MKAVVTVTGTDKKGVIARVSGYLFGRDINILDVSQTILGDQFAMMMIADIPDTTDFSLLQDEICELGQSFGMQIRLQHADIFDAMHNV